MNDPVSEKVIGAAFTVYNELGFGFFESIYENALAIELASSGVQFESQYPLVVRYRGHVVGKFVCDLLVEGELILELKSVATLSKAHEVQLVNYLTATNTPAGLLLNFGPKGVEVKRKFR